MSNFIPEHGRALILAATVLDRVNADPDDDLAVLARQLVRTSEANDLMRRELRKYGIWEVTNLGSEQESRRPRRYFECRLCGDWNDAVATVEHADGCPLRT